MFGNGEDGVFSSSFLVICGIRDLGRLPLTLKHARRRKGKKEKKKIGFTKSQENAFYTWHSKVCTMEENQY